MENNRLATGKSMRSMRRIIPCRFCPPWADSHPCVHFRYAVCGKLPDKLLFVLCSGLLVFVQILCYFSTMKIRNVLCVCMVISLFISCASTKKVPLYPTILADMEPFPLGTLNASVERSFSTRLQSTDVEVIFHPRKNEVALEFRHGVSYYVQFWDQAGRLKFIEALKMYKEDFANQNLSTRYGKTRAIYGKAKGRFQWEPLKVSPKYLSSPEIDLGYRFRDGSPYLSFYQKIADEETKFNKDSVTQSPAYSIYFTRAQGDELARMFDQSFLVALLGGATPPVAVEPVKDIYKEK